MLKLRSDMLFLTLDEAVRRLIVLTEKDMYELYLKEVAGDAFRRKSSLSVLRYLTSLECG